MSKIIADTEENLNSLMNTWKTVTAPAALIPLGREFTVASEFESGGNLINLHRGKNYTTTTDQWDIVKTDPVVGTYIMHPDKKRGNWEDQCIDIMIAEIPETATVIDNFTPSEEEI